MGNYDFKQDLILGNKGEDIVIKDLQRMGANFISKNNDNKFDIIMESKGKEIKYEIKTDVFCKPDYDTGNIFVEYECRGKESGIMVTQAKWFVTYYKYLNEIWYIKTKDLLKLLNNNDVRKTQYAGDNGSNTKGWLFPRLNYEKHFIIREF